MTPPEGGVEFDCIDCGIHVYRPIQQSANDQHLCFECQWLRAIEDPKEREALRRLLCGEEP